MDERNAEKQLSRAEKEAEVARLQKEIELARQEFQRRKAEKQTSAIVDTPFKSKNYNKKLNLFSNVSKISLAACVMMCLVLSVMLVLRGPGLSAQTGGGLMGIDLGVGALNLRQQSTYGYVGADKTGSLQIVDENRVEIDKNSFVFLNGSYVDGSDPFRVYLINIAPEETLGILLKQFERANIRVYESDGATPIYEFDNHDDDALLEDVCTGWVMRAYIMQSDQWVAIDEITLVVIGDLDGDSRLSVYDYVEAEVYLNNPFAGTLTGAFWLAATILGESRVSMYDLEMKEVYLNGAVTMFEHYRLLDPGILAQDTQLIFSMGGGDFVDASPQTVFKETFTIFASDLPRAEQLGWCFMGWRDSTGSMITNLWRIPAHNDSATARTLTAVWEEQMTVTYKSGFGTGQDIIVYYEVDKTTADILSDNPFAHSDADFIGWNTANNGTGTTFALGQTGVPLTNHIVLFATWSIDITYMANNGTGITPSVQTVTLGNSSFEFEDNELSRANLTYVNGWNLAANGSGIHFANGASTDSLTGHTTVYATWKITVTFDDNGSTGGTHSTTQEWFEGGTAPTIQANTLTRTNLTRVNGWNAAGNGTGAWVTDLSQFTQNSTVFAVWQVDISYYNYTDAAPVSVQSWFLGDTGTQNAIVNNLTRTNLTHRAGWYSTAIGGTHYADGSNISAFTQNTNLYATWMVGFSINGNGHTSGTLPGGHFWVLGSPDTGTRRLIIPSPRLERTGLTYKDQWSATADGSDGVFYYAGSNFGGITENITLYAIWWVQITYNGNGHTGGNLPVLQEWIFGCTNEQFVATNNLTRTGLTRVDNWGATAIDGSGTYTNGEDLSHITQNTTLFAVWRVEVSYNGNGYTGGSTPESTSWIFGDFAGAVNTTTVATQNLIRTGLTTHNSWHMNGTTGTRLNGGASLESITQNTVLYAAWEVVITYNGNGHTSGTLPTEQRWFLNNAGTERSALTTGIERTGLTNSAQWIIGDPLGTNRIGENNTAITARTQNTTLYLGWMVVVTYDGNGHTGGTPGATTSWFFGQPAESARNVPETLVRAGLTRHNSWHINGITGTRINGGANLSEITQNTTLFAAWEVVITYNGNGNTGGTLPTTQRWFLNNAGSHEVATQNLTRTDLTTHNSWHQDSTTGTRLNGGADISNLTQNLTLFAAWEVVVTYNGNGNTGGTVPAVQRWFLNNAGTQTLATQNLTRTNLTTHNSWHITSTTGVRTNGGASIATLTANTTYFAAWEVVITYNGNGHTGGTVGGTTLAVGATREQRWFLNNAGTQNAQANALTRNNLTFVTGWFTANNGTGTTYANAANIAELTANTTLFACWQVVITYDTNGATSGTTNTFTILGGATVRTQAWYVGQTTPAVIANQLDRTSLGRIAGWNTQANGTGTAYAAGATTITQNTTLYATWLVTITYDGNGNTGGTVPSAVSWTLGNAGTQTAATQNLTRTNLTTHNSWHANSVTGTRTNGGADIATRTANTTFFAAWEVVITYNGNGHTGGTVPTQRWFLNNAGTQTLATQNLTRTNLTTHNSWHIGSTTGARTAGGANIATLTANTTYFAAWEVVITYDGNGHTGGTLPAVQRWFLNNAGTQTLANQTLTRTNLTTHDSWHNGSPTGTRFAGGTTDISALTANRTYFAAWQIVITYNGNGHTSGTINTTELPIGGTRLQEWFLGAAAPTVLNHNLARTNLTRHASWHMGSTTGTRVANGAAMPETVTQNTTFFAAWEVVITYNGNGNTGGSVPAVQRWFLNNAGTQTLATQNLTRTNLTTHNSWHNGTTTGTRTNGGASIATLTANTTYFAAWEVVITYNGNGSTSGTVPAVQRWFLNNAGTQTLATQNLSRTGVARHDSWHADSTTGARTAGGANIATLTANTTYFAAWEVIITYNGNGYTGGTVPAQQRWFLNNAGTQTLATQNLTRTNLTTHNSWHSGSEFGTRLAGGTSIATITTNTTFFAAWQVTMTFDRNGGTGSIPAPVTWIYRESNRPIIPDVPTDLVRTGLTRFNAWHIDNPNDSWIENPGNEFELETNRTLYAVWQVVITFNGNGHTSGTVPANLTWFLGQTQPSIPDVPTNLARTGLTRENAWHIGGANVNSFEYPGNDFGLNSNTTLYAAWRVTVTYRGNNHTGGDIGGVTLPTGANASTTQTWILGIPGTQQARLNNLTRTNTTRHPGWRTTANGVTDGGTLWNTAGSTQYDNFANLAGLTQDLTLFACWTVTVQYHLPNTGWLPNTAFTGGIIDGRGNNFTNAITMFVGTEWIAPNHNLHSNFYSFVFTPHVGDPNMYYDQFHWSATPTNQTLHHRGRSSRNYTTTFDIHTVTPGNKNFYPITTIKIHGPGITVPTGIVVPWDTEFYMVCARDEARMFTASTGGRIGGTIEGYNESAFTTEILPKPTTVATAFRPGQDIFFTRGRDSFTIYYRVQGSGSAWTSRLLY